MTTGSKLVTWSSVFSVTQRSRKPCASARWATVRIASTSSPPGPIGSGERCGRDRPKGMRFASAMRSGLLDDFDLGAVRCLHEGNAVAVAALQFFKDFDAVGAKLG